MTDKCLCFLVRCVEWGLVVYRETALLWDPSTGSDAELQRVASVISHELAHQNFGNLVTCGWWSDIWLNEGFATFVSYIGVDALFPDWQYWQQFMVEMQAAMTVDSSSATHPVVVPNTVTAADISKLFDTISYSKGGTLLRMFEAAFTKPIFAAALQSYLNHFKYKNPFTQDLWNELQTFNPTTSINFTLVGNSWTMQSGYPYLVIAESPVGNNTVWTFAQKRFFSTPTNKPEDYSQWYVPLSFMKIMNNGTFVDQPMQWLQPDIPVSITVETADLLYVKVNVNQTGMYRPLYSEPHWNKLSDALNGGPAVNFNQLSIEDRSGLIDDSFAFAFAGQLDFAYPLKLARYLRAENALTPFVTAARWFAKIDPFISDANDRTLFYAYMNATLGTFDSSWTQTPPRWGSHVANMLTAQVFAMSVRYNVGNTREFATSAWNALFSQGAPVWVEISQTVYSFAVTSLGQPAFDYLFDLYQKSNNQAERDRCSAALAMVNDTALMSRLLQATLNSNIVRRQDSARILQLAAANPYLQPEPQYNGLTVVQAFLRDNLKTLATLPGFSGLGRVITALVSPIMDSATLSLVKGFVDASGVIASSSATFSTHKRSIKQMIISGSNKYTAQQISVYLNTPSNNL